MESVTQAEILHSDTPERFRIPQRRLPNPFHAEIIPGGDMALIWPVDDGRKRCIRPAESHYLIGPMPPRIEIFEYIPLEGS